jgi:hypothetical protein
MDPPAVFLCANNLQSFGSMASEENTISSVPPQSENASTDQVHSSIDYKLCDTKHPGTISSANEAATARDTLLNDTEPDINNYRSYGDAYYRYVRFYVNGWAWSILSWFFAANSLLAIALVLAGMNEEYLSTWTHQITINTVMAILSQLGSTLLMVPLAEAISQLKWLWFYRQSKLLRDFDDFDRASRGPWFSFLLIWKTRAR